MTQYDVERREWGKQYPAYVKWLDLMHEKSNLIRNAHNLADLDLKESDWYNDFYFNSKGVNIHVVTKGMSEENRKDILLHMDVEYKRLLNKSEIPYTEKQLNENTLRFSRNA